MRILRDIVAGQTDPHQLAKHRDHRCRASETEVAAALTGNYRPEHLVHGIVPGGGLSLDGKRWVAARHNFFLPVRPLSRLFRGKFLSYLQQTFQQGKLCFHGQLEPLARPANWKRWRKKLRSKDWVVYVKPPYGGPQQVLKYLARYTHRVAISNQRLLSIHDGHVAFRWKDYAHRNQQPTMVLDARSSSAAFSFTSSPPQQDSPTRSLAPP